MAEKSTEAFSMKLRPVVTLIPIPKQNKQTQNLYIGL